MKKPSIIIAFVAALCPLFSTVKAGEETKVRRLLSGLVNRISSAYPVQTLLVRKNVAIVGISDESESAKKKKVGRMMADLLGAEVSRSTVFQLVERQDIAAVLKEQSIQMSGLTDPAGAAKAGEILNADLLLTGSVTEIGDDFLLSVKLIDVENGSVISESVSIPKRYVLGAAEERLDMAYVQNTGVGISFSLLGNTVCGVNSTLDPTGVWFDEKATGFGYPGGFEVRYRFTRNLMMGTGLDLVSAQVWRKESQQWDVPYGNTNGSAPFRIIGSGWAIPINLYGNINLTRRLNIFAGSGLMLHQIDFSGLFEPSNGNGFGINEFGPVRDKTFFVGFRFFGGAEIFLAPRLAVSLQAGYDLRSYELDLGMWHLPGLPQSVEIDMSGFSYQINTSFYF